MHTKKLLRSLWLAIFLLPCAAPAQSQTLNDEYILYFSHFPAIRIFYKDIFAARTPSPGTYEIHIIMDLSSASEDEEDANWAKTHVIEIQPEYESAKGRLSFAFTLPLYGESYTVRCVGYILPAGQSPVIAGLYYINDKEQGTFVVRRDESSVPLYRSE